MYDNEFRFITFIFLLGLLLNLRLKGHIWTQTVQV